MSESDAHYAYRYLQTFITPVVVIAVTCASTPTARASRNKTKQKTYHCLLLLPRLSRGLLSSVQRRLAYPRRSRRPRHVSHPRPIDHPDRGLRHGHEVVSRAAVARVVFVDHRHGRAVDAQMEFGAVEAYRLFRNRPWWFWHALCGNILPGSRAAPDCGERSRSRVLCLLPDVCLGEYLGDGLSPSSRSNLSFQVFIIAS